MHTWVERWITGEAHWNSPLRRKNCPGVSATRRHPTKGRVAAIGGMTLFALASSHTGPFPTACASGGIFDVLVSDPIVIQAHSL